MPDRWLSNKSSRKALGARLCGGAVRFKVLLLPCIVKRSAVLCRRKPVPTSAPRLGGKLGGKLGDPGGLGPMDERARE